MSRFLKHNVPLLLFFLSTIVVLGMAALTAQIMLTSAGIIENTTKKEVVALSEAVAFLSSPEELDRFRDITDMQSPEYAELRKKLNVFSNQSGSTFAYYMRLDKDTNKMQFIIDSVLDPAGQDGLDSPQVAREEAPDSALTGKATTAGLGNYSEGWDGLLSAFAPMYYKDGTISDYVAGVDMQDIYIKAIRNNIYVMSVVMIISILIVTSSAILCLNLYRKKARQSESANIAKNSFLSRMSHEMRTPMNAIMGLCDMSMKSDDPDRIKSYLASIGAASQHLRHIVDDVLDTSKIESGTLQLELQAADPHGELEKIYSLVRSMAEEKEQTLSINFSPDLPAKILCDKIRLRQILLNLLSNAIKFTPARGVILLSISLLEKKDNRCHLEWSVKDNGIGIENTERIFLAFEQEDNTNTRRFGGTGLGLSISQKLVGMMGGTIQVKSEPNIGTEFVFDLWLEILEEKSADDDVSAVASDLDLSGKNILLVEDVEINKLIAVDLLEGFGATVDTADDGAKGLESYLYGNGKYNLIFMDIQMPVMDGYETSRRIRSSGRVDAKTIPIIAITANVFPEDIEKAFAAGMNAHVGKPLDIQQIKTAIQRVLTV